MSTKAGASDHLYLFIYANYFLSTCAHRMNINIYLFTYSKRCQHNHTQATTCICLFMQITCCLHVLFVWILISICLLIQRDVNKIIRSSLARSIYESDPELDKEYIATSSPSFFNCWGLILLNCSNIFFYITVQYQICHKCCNIWSLTRAVAWRSFYWWWIWRKV